MSTNAARDNGAETATLSQKLNDFIVKFRILIISAFVALALVLVTLMTYTTIVEKKSSSALERTETLMKDWETAKGANDQAALAAKEDETIGTLLKLAKSNNGSFAGARAYMSAAEIYFSRKDWKNAEENYLAAAKSAPKAYTAGLCYYNAAVSADEQGNADKAVEALDKAIALDGFTLKSRAYFNLGRIEEQRGHAEAALAAYQKLAEQYPDDEWTKLAKSRIIALEIK